MSLILIFLSGCIWDRTGQSMTTALRRQVSHHSAELKDIEEKIKNMSSRIAQIEATTRSQGRERILKMESMEDLRTELANLRNDVETMGYAERKQEQTLTALTEDSAYRLEELETRADRLEKELGISDDADSTDSSAAEETAPEGSNTGPSNSASEPTAEDLLLKAKDHLTAGREVAAEATLRRHFELHPKSATHNEALYRYAEAAFNQENYKEAASRFQEVLGHNSKSSYASWAMLRQAECFEKQGDKETATLFYEDVITDYPNSDAAKVAKKKNKAK